MLNKNNLFFIFYFYFECEKLQIKNEQCIYDFPELWLLNENSNSFNNNSSTASDLDESNSEFKASVSGEPSKLFFFSKSVFIYNKSDYY